MSRVPGKPLFDLPTFPKENLRIIRRLQKISIVPGGNFFRRHRSWLRGRIYLESG
jgi:hypothetical protein